MGKTIIIADENHNTCEFIDENGVKRLAVDAKISSGSGGGNQSLYDNPVHKYQTFSININQLNYTVPSGKKLYILTLFVALNTSDGGDIMPEFQADDVGFASFGMAGDGTQSANSPAPNGAPWGPFSAGTVIRARRIHGDSSKGWSSGFTGYLEDA